jgi:DNA invertase Pin-like site-specific DNA recombinase
MTTNDLRKVLQLQRDLIDLPSRYGFANMGDFVLALQEILKAGGTEPVSSEKKRQRGKLTDKSRKQIKDLLEAGKTVREISEDVKLSVPTVHKVKKELGMVRARAPVEKSAVMALQPTEK